MKREEIHSTDYGFPCVLYIPEKMPKNCPLVIQLHGAGEKGSGGSDLQLVDKNGFPDLLQKEGADYPCIFALPQCPSDSSWGTEIPNIYQFICRVIEAYHVDKTRVYLTGLSMGGYGTWMTACRYPKLFAALVPICGGGIVSNVSDLDMPVWAWHGTEDEAVLPSESINMIQEMRKGRPNDENIKLTLLEGVGHNVWENACNEDVLAWMLSKHR